MLDLVVPRPVRIASGAGLSMGMLAAGGSPANHRRPDTGAGQADCSAPADSLDLAAAAQAAADAAFMAVAMSFAERAECGMRVRGRGA